MDHDGPRFVGERCKPRSSARGTEDDSPEQRLAPIDQHEAAETREAGRSEDEPARMAQLIELAARCSEHICVHLADVDCLMAEIDSHSSIIVETMTFLFSELQLPEEKSVQEHDRYIGK